MYYDLNVPWPGVADQKLLRTLAFLHELGYNTVAVNHTITGKLPADLTSPIPPSLPYPTLPSALTLLRRVTLTLTESHQNARLALLAKEYDLLALRPIDEHTMHLACTSLDCDIISLDLTQRLSFYPKHKSLNEAVRAGKLIELCYSPGLSGDAQARRNLISNATLVIRACRGRGVIVSSEARGGAVGCRGPADVVNLLQVWGLGQERGFEALTKGPRGAVVKARLKREGYRGVVGVVFGGEKGEKEKEGAQKEGKKGKGKQTVVLPQGTKRKAEDEGKGGDGGERKIDAPPQISKREAKRRAKQAREKEGMQKDGEGEKEKEFAQGPKRKAENEEEEKEKNSTLEAKRSANQAGEQGAGASSTNKAGEEGPAEEASDEAAPAEEAPGDEAMRE